MKQLWAWVVAILAIFAPIKAAAICAIVLVFADLITGVWAAKKRQEKITSGGLKRSIGKLALYETAICLGFLAQTYLTGSVLPVCSLITSVVGLTEMKSVLENLDSINGTSFYQSVIDKITQSKNVTP